MAYPLLSVIIVSFNTRELLRRCLVSLIENRHYSVMAIRPANLQPHQEPQELCAESPPCLLCEVVVVDNASTDGSADMVRTEFQTVSLVTAEANLGFARASNLGLARSRGDLLLLLNPDTEVVGDALVAMADFLVSHRNVAAVGPALIYPDGSLQHSAFRFPNLLMSLFDFFPINHRVINSRLNGRYRVPRDHRPFPVDHPLGAAMMLRRDALDDVGLLDEGYFMYCEEVDWCLRARRRGWQIYQIPSATIIHHAAQSTRQHRERMLVELHRSRYRLFRKHYSGGFIQAHRVITRAGLVYEAVRAHWLARKGRIGKDELERRMQAYRQIWSM